MSYPLPTSIRGVPVLAIHPSALYELRSSPSFPGPRSRFWALLRPQAQKIVNDPTLHSVTYSPRYGPGGPNAFLSFAPYFHPEPKQLKEYLNLHPGAPPEEWEDKIDWVRRDGDRYKELQPVTQLQELNEVCDKVFILGLAFLFATVYDPALAKLCAQKSYQLLHCFFGDTQTFMLPETPFAQYVRGRQPKSAARPEGFIHLRALVALSRVLPVLPSPDEPDPEIARCSPHAFLVPWLSQHVHYSLTSDSGRAALGRTNNIGSWYLVLLSTHLVALNRGLEAHQYIAGVFLPRDPTSSSLLSRKVDSKTGAMLEEVKRTQPYHYSAFELEALVYLVELATAIKRFTPNTQHLPDLWPAETDAVKRGVQFALLYQKRTWNPRAQRGKLPTCVPREPEAAADSRALFFAARSVSMVYGAASDDPIGALLASTSQRPIEEGKEGPYTRWNVRAKMLWALLEGY